TLALITCARALALIRGRTYVVPEDVKALAHPALDHRVTVKPELWLQNATGAGVVESVLGQVEVPAAVSPPVAVGGRGCARHPCSPPPRISANRGGPGPRPPCSARRWPRARR